MKSHPKRIIIFTHISYVLSYHGHDVLKEIKITKLGWPINKKYKGISLFLQFNFQISFDGFDSGCSINILCSKYFIYIYIYLKKIIVVYSFGVSLPEYSVYNLEAILCLTSKY